MARRVLLVLGLALLLMAFGVWTASGQEGGEGESGEGEGTAGESAESAAGGEEYIFTTATNAVGVGTYVAAQAYAVPAGEDPAAEPVEAFVFPYGIDARMQLTDIQNFVEPEPEVEGFTFEWALEVPEGSSSELIHTGPVAIFMPDVEGTYLLTLTATDANGNSGTKTWEVTASTYVGVGGLGPDAPTFPECGTCHGEQGQDWYATAHATVFSRGITGEWIGPAFSMEQVPHTTTGYNTLPTADNNGFDDRAREAGWVLPAIEPGAWEAMWNEFPQVAALANVQCEACHGPGNLHTTQQTPESKKIGLGVAAGVCAQCHAASPEPIVAQWEASAHADHNAEAFWYPIGEDRANCVRCHSGLGYIDAVSGVATEEQRTEHQVITCAVCHDPHNAANPNQLRVFDVVVLPDGTEVTGRGPAATCMTCHNARTAPNASVDAAVAGENFSLPHYSVAAELMTASGGYTWGQTLPTSPHGQIIPNTCIGCHMAAPPEGETLVGGHTFSMVSPEGVENVAVCQGCHGQVESFAFDAKADYDGDGTVETNQDEVAGLLEALQNAVVEAGVTVLESHPYFEVPEGANADLYGAVYNLKFARDAAAAPHNLKYTVALLQLSYQKVTGQPLANAELLASAE